jgi:hypothetical protein
VPTLRQVRHSVQQAGTARAVHRCCDDAREARSFCPSSRPPAPTVASCTTTPSFIAPLSDEQLFGLVLHEASHVVLMHMWRRDGRDMALWNYANDAIINAYIKGRGWRAA